VLDILAMQAFAAAPYKLYGSDAANRAGLASDDYMTLTQINKMRAQLEDMEVPGVAATDADQMNSLVMTTTPRVIYGIRENNTTWLEAQEYAGSARLFNGEMGTWGGVRFVRTNRLRLWNGGTAAHQSTLSAATVPGQGARATVDAVYTVGQSNATRYITVADTTGFAVGMYVTIHSADLGATVLETDGTTETRRIEEIGAGGKLYLNKPLLKPHASGDYVTNGLDVHLSILHGGPSVVYGIGEAPNVILPPKYDDLMILNRIGWRAFIKFQVFRPEVIRVMESAAPAV